MGALSPVQVAHYAHDAGIPWVVTPIAVAVAWAESGLDPNARGTAGGPGGPEDSRGLWQINILGNPSYQSWNLYDPATNAKAMAQLSRNGTQWGDWTTFNGGAYKQFLQNSVDATNQACGGTCVPGSLIGTQYNPSLYIAAAGAAQASGDTSQQSGPSCQHSIGSVGSFQGLCLDKPLAILEIAGGVTIMLIGVVILGVALVAGSFPGVRQAAELYPPVRLATRGARRLSPTSSRTAAPGPPQTYEPPAPPGYVKTSGGLRKTRAPRPNEAGSNVVTLGGRNVDVRTLSPRMREAIEARRAS